VPVPRLRASLAALLLTAVLAACGAPEPAPAAPEGGGGGGPFPVTIEHAFGTATIERAPSGW
jgi:iron complex transport system substrate-binding protein